MAALEAILGALGYTGGTGIYWEALGYTGGTGSRMAALEAVLGALVCPAVGAHWGLGGSLTLPAGWQGLSLPRPSAHWFILVCTGVQAARGRRCPSTRTGTPPGATTSSSSRGATAPGPTGLWGSGCRGCTCRWVRGPRDPLGSPNSLDPMGAPHGCDTPGLKIPWVPSVTQRPYRCPPWVPPVTPRPHRCTP